MKTNRFLLLLQLGIFTFLPAVHEARAVTLLTVDAVDDTLLAIDTETGIVTLLGPLLDVVGDPYDVTRPALALAGDTLYMLDTNGVLPRVTLVTVDWPTTTVLATVQVFFDEGAGPIPATAAEGLAILNGVFYASYVDGVGNPASSDKLGVLDPVTGIITGGVQLDHDGDLLDNSGQFLIGIDGFSVTVADTDFYRLDPVTGIDVQQPVRYLGHPGLLRLRGFDKASDGVLYVNSREGLLFEIDPITFDILGVSTLSPALEYRGLAEIPAISDLCPCEADWRNHGQYVSCVAHAAQEFRNLGLITGAQVGSIVSAAAQSDCGK